MQTNFTQEWQLLSGETLAADLNWWEIYVNSFPPAEQDSKQQLLAAVEKGIAAAVACRRQDRTVAIAVFYPLQTQAWSFIFLNYFAVAQELRGQGLGQQLFNGLLQQKQAAAVVWEVERPDDAKDAAEKKLRERRIKFYRKAGAEWLNCEFIQPPIDGLHRIPMRLMYYRLNEQVNWDECAESIVHTIYFKKYHPVNQISPTILQELLAHIFS